MAVTRNQPIAKAPRESRVRLGELLFRRREELGYGDSRPRFYAATGVNRRFSDDLENARRSNFEEPFLRMAARGYAVSYERMIDVAWGKADGLVPARPGTPAPPAAPALPPPPPGSEIVREDAVRRYADPIWVKLIELRDQGIADPSGAQLGLDPFSARVWDDSAGSMVLSDRVWLAGTVLRNAAAWDEDRKPDADSA